MIWNIFLALKIYEVVRIAIQNEPDLCIVEDDLLFKSLTDDTLQLMHQHLFSDPAFGDDSLSQIVCVSDTIGIEPLIELYADDLVVLETPSNMNTDASFNLLNDFLAENLNRFSAIWLNDSHMSVESISLSNSNMSVECDGMSIDDDDERETDFEYAMPTSTLDKMLYSLYHKE